MHVKWFTSRGSKKSANDGGAPAPPPTSGSAPRVTFAAPEISTAIDAEAHADVLQTAPLLLGGSPPRPSSLAEEKLHAPPKLMKGTPAKQAAALSSPQAGRPTRVPKERQA